MDNENQSSSISDQKILHLSSIINESSYDTTFNSLFSTLKQIESLINSLPINTETESTISSLKEKISLSQTQLSELKSQRNSENSNSNLPQVNNINNINTIQSMDNKIDLVLNKMEIMLNLINSKNVEIQGSDEPVEKVYENGDKYLGQ